MGWAQGLGAMAGKAIKPMATGASKAMPAVRGAAKAIGVPTMQEMKTAPIKSTLGFAVGSKASPWIKYPAYAGTASGLGRTAYRAGSGINQGLNAASQEAAQTVGQIARLNPDQENEIASLAKKKMEIAGAKSLIPDWGYRLGAQMGINEPDTPLASKQRQTARGLIGDSIGYSLHHATEAPSDMLDRWRKVMALRAPVPAAVAYGGLAAADGVAGKSAPPDPAEAAKGYMHNTWQGGMGLTDIWNNYQQQINSPYGKDMGELFTAANAMKQRERANPNAGF